MCESKAFAMLPFVLPAGNLFIDTEIEVEYEIKRQALRLNLVMAVILFEILASAILFAHRESQIIAEYVVHQAAEEGSHLEEIYEKKGCQSRKYSGKSKSVLWGWWISCQKHL